jgi:chromate transporter
MKSDRPPSERGDIEVTLRDVWRVFGTIGISSFGGGLSGWMFREIVERLRWISPEEFLAGLALARTMPGPNVVNLAIWIGYRLRKTRGALVASCAVLAGPLVLILILATVYERIKHSITVHQLLMGVTAAALGLSLSVGIKSFQAAARSPFYAVIAVLTFIGVGILHQPLLPIACTAAAVSVAWAFFLDRTDEG